MILNCTNVQRCNRVCVMIKDFVLCSIGSWILFHDTSCSLFFFWQSSLGITFRKWYITACLGQTQSISWIFVFLRSNDTTLLDMIFALRSSQLLFGAGIQFLCLTSMFSPLSTSYGHWDCGACFGLALALIWVSAWDRSTREVGREVEAVHGHVQELKLRPLHCFLDCQAWRFDVRV